MNDEFHALEMYVEGEGHSKELAFFVFANSK